MNNIYGSARGELKGAKAHLPKPTCAHAPLRRPAISQECTIQTTQPSAHGPPPIKFGEPTATYNEILRGHSGLKPVYNNVPAGSQVSRILACPAATIGKSALLQTASSTIETAGNTDSVVTFRRSPFPNQQCEQLDCFRQTHRRASLFIHRVPIATLGEVRSILEGEPVWNQAGTDSSPCANAYAQVPMVVACPDIFNFLTPTISP